jgi:hypothetical protein
VSPTCNYPAYNHRHYQFDPALTRQGIHPCQPKNSQNAASVYTQQPGHCNSDDERNALSLPAKLDKFSYSSFDA